MAAVTSMVSEMAPAKALTSTMQKSSASKHNGWGPLSVGARRVLLRPARGVAQVDEDARKWSKRTSAKRHVLTFTNRRQAVRDDTAERTGRGILLRRDDCGPEREGREDEHDGFSGCVRRGCVGGAWGQLAVRLHKQGDDAEMMRGGTASHTDGCTRPLLSTRPTQTPQQHLALLCSSSVRPINETRRFIARVGGVYRTLKQKHTRASRRGRRTSSRRQP